MSKSRIADRYLKRCQKCGGPMQATYNAGGDCTHGISLKKHCCKCHHEFLHPTER